MRICSILLFSLLLSACAMTAPTRVHVVPPRWEKAYDDYHYSPSVRVGDTVYVSGIPAAPGDTYEARVRSMFERLKSLLAASGASLDDVVEITTFHAQPKDSVEFDTEFEIFKKIHGEYFHDHYPAWTAVGTTALISPGAPVEMRAVAVIGSGRKAVRAASAAPTH